MTFTLIHATKTPSTQRKNFLLIENTFFEFLQSEEAEKKSGISGAKLLTIYQNLRYALTRYGTKPLHLKIESTVDGCGILTPWEHLCKITKCASATLAKALNFLAEAGLINRTTHLRNGLPLLISFNLPEDSFRPKEPSPSPIPSVHLPSPPAPSPAPASPNSNALPITSRIPLDTSKPEASFNKERKHENIPINTPLRGEPVNFALSGFQKAIQESEARLTKQFTQTLWAVVDDIYALQVRHNAQAARVGASTIYKQLKQEGFIKPIAKPTPQFTSPPEQVSEANLKQAIPYFVSEAKKVGFEVWASSFRATYDTTETKWNQVMQQVRQQM